MNFLWKGCVIFCLVRLHDFLCEEVALVFMKRGCVTFLWRGCVIFLLSLHDFCGGEVVRVFLEVA